MNIDSKVASSPLRRRLRRLGRWERREEAIAFIDQFHRECELPDADRLRRRREALRHLARHGWYEHTPAELAFGARVAWRNHSRCIGRLAWKSLEVVDCRTVIDPDAIAARVFDHLAEAAGDGAIRSIITVFAPVRGEAIPAWIESRQALQYAGYAEPGRATLGDPITVETTRIARGLGWRPPDPPGPFDILPLIVRDSRDRRLVYELPARARREVEIAHPRDDRFAGLGLRWYAVPCVSSMILTIGGIDYPCAPFNGHYMVTEIASRNLADERRHDLLPTVARTLGIDLEDPLWKDRALTELNAAVLHSYRSAGVTIVDHHEASEQYMQFMQREASAGRTPSGDWSWIVPPQAGSSCPVFHVGMRDRGLVPNYYISRALDGNGLGPRYDDEPRCPLRRRWDRLRRRWYDWRRLRD
jgi:nitric-oxide synthase